MHTIGILALQGAFLEHGQMLEGLGVEHFEIRQPDDLNRPMDGLILPGGESTAMGKLMDCLDMLQPLRERIAGGLPVFGTCAGMILLAKDLGDEPRRRSPGHGRRPHRSRPPAQHARHLLPPRAERRSAHPPLVPRAPRRSLNITLNIKKRVRQIFCFAHSLLYIRRVIKKLDNL